MVYRPLNSLITIKAIRTIRNARLFHAAIGTFVALDSSGKPVTREVKLIHGNAGESYILIPPEIGFALQAGSIPSNDISLKKDSESYALTFFHETKTFVHESSPGFPRLEIPQDLPRQTKTNKSPATLFLTGVSHEITLDGTPDAKFAAMATESYQRLKPSLDRLKDM
ncbi:MAG: hypothetical protein M1834_002970 [Cirrosporium novae-zelandiae]|nr:MAG: hypothetical protein M1834_002970 [Cirrosporium novae-zelandiae]